MQFFVAVLCVGATVIGASCHGNPHLNDAWEEFKATYNKVYAPEEEALRRGVWEQHLQLVDIHNRLFVHGLTTFTLATNEYADMSNEEFRAKMNGYRMRGHSGNPLFSSTVNVSSLAVEVDWRKKGFVTAVKNQQQCGSCWAFSTTGSLEGQHFNKTNKLVSLSEQNLVDCSTKEGNQGCGGGLMDNAFKYIKENGGIDTEASYPYEAKNGKCRFSADNVGATLTSWMDIASGSEEDLQKAVATVGPISVAIDAGHITFQLYHGGVYNPWFCSSKVLDHGVLAVGYGTYNELDYWLVKNSWGSSWGLHGYIMMARNKNNKCGIATQASFPVV